MFCAGAVFRRSVIRGRDRMAVFLSAGDGEGAVRGTCAPPASAANAASLRTSLRRASTGVSQDLVDRVDGAFSAPIAARYCEEPIQEPVLRVRGLEARYGPEVIGRGVDALAARERRHHFRRPVTKPERGHVDESAVVGLERKAQVELEDAVSPEECPVTATRQHLSAQPRALEVAARYRCGDASTVRHGADFLYADDRDLQRHQQTGIHSSTALRSFGSMVASTGETMRVFVVAPSSHVPGSTSPPPFLRETGSTRSSPRSPRAPLRGSPRHWLQCPPSGRPGNSPSPLPGGSQTFVGLWYGSWGSENRRREIALPTGGRRARDEDRPLDVLPLGPVALDDRRLELREDLPGVALGHRPRGLLVE